ncbi:MAG: hypothetical protein ACD_2C00152G0008 [uncultured bacterium (gcode 4)]|uniref:Uncharacterized protein n=1 Tax=uncultured bacterium (gcode 4) TaxID=1234023 RepID=K2GGJ7_9BACT|nr:MAG: hypothetical protein ACD_2C00152G0008 [uncultured bacterium (gcode 4)]
MTDETTAIEAEVLDDAAKKVETTETAETVAPEATAEAAPEATEEKAAA